MRRTACSGVSARVVARRLGDLLHGCASPAVRVRAFHDVRDRLADAARRDAVLQRCTRSACARRRSVSSIARCIEPVIRSAYRIALPLQVARRAADGLDQRALRAQEAFLVRIEDRDQRHLGHVEAFAQQVDADQHVELAEAQVADDLHALDRVDVRVQVAHAARRARRGTR